LQKLLNKTAALVCHAGIGTCAQAMRAGIPQLMAPVFFDQFDNARRIEAMGLGKTVSAKNFNRSEVAENLNTLLHADVVRHTCRRVADQFGNGNLVTEICKIVVSLGREAASQG
jgi:rhamnosyltransferase subunit B